MRIGGYLTASGFRSPRVPLAVSHSTQSDAGVPLPGSNPGVSLQGLGGLGVRKASIHSRALVLLAAKAHLGNRVKKNTEESRAPKMIFLILEPRIVFMLSDQIAQQEKAVMAIMSEHTEKGRIQSDCILLPER